ncbi:SGNH/GDSL hydrolase family protein [Pedobacter fastidiosus]|uniref:SGNH/GDSL hydrolase family protein n=1 Tax=Pedobacter fastidiosus TaxID=2765361 RepID=A0ABR7KR97_9SPHI|nr:SGNH/GDSL hydrolase family protein [Pedobacter fastidiosus]MBC6110551.1 SGNH/GDSL hydrolase family protein [Pedobacter fastidiosus]
MKILCIGDSLSLPGHGNQSKDIWFSKLQEEYKEWLFFSLFKRSITTNILVEEGGGDDTFPGGADCLEFFMPQAIVIQLGIVDCAPRLFGFKSLLPKILNLFPAKPRHLSFKMIKKLKKRKAKNAYVSPEKFEFNLTNYLNRCAACEVKKVIFIKICTPDESFIKKNQDILTAVKLYNNILDKMVQNYSFFETINPLSNNLEGIYEDGYHPNPLGNERVFEELNSRLKDV